VKKALLLLLAFLFLFSCGSMLPLSESSLDRATFIYKDDNLLVASVARQLANVGYGFDVLLINKGKHNLYITYDEFDFVIEADNMERYTIKESSKSYFPMDLKPDESVNLIFVAPKDVSPATVIHYGIFILEGKEYRMEKR